MRETAESKYTEAFAHDIAAVLRSGGRGAPVEVVFDRLAEGWAVRLDMAGDGRHEMIMPSPGALFTYWRNGVFRAGSLGGLRLGSATPVEVARAFLGAVLDLPPA